MRKEKTISIKRLMELNPSIKSIAQAKKILNDYKTKPKAILVLNGEIKINL